MQIHKFNNFLLESNTESNLILIKNALAKIFLDDSVGKLNSTKVSNNYSYYTIKTIFYDDINRYILYLKLDNIDDELKIDLILKKYDINTTKLIGISNDEITDIKKLDKDYLINLKSKIDDDFKIDDDELKIDYEKNV